MAIVFDNKQSASTNGTALQFNLTAASNATLVVFTANDNGRSISAIAYAGNALTRLAMAAAGECEVWGLANPPNGVNILSAQIVGAAINFCMIGLTYTGTKAAGPFGTGVSATTTGTTANLSFSSTTTDIVVGGFKTNFGTLVANNGTTRASETASASVRLVVADITGALAITLSATSGGSPSWAMTGVPLIFSAASATGPSSLKMLTGIGG